MPLETPSNRSPNHGSPDHANSDHRRPDLAMKSIIALLALIAAWLLAMPVVPAIASATLHRFHLRSPGFAVWAIQFPIPAMYNFANRYHVRSTPEDHTLTSPPGGRMLNHFPARIVTFADGRYTYLRDGKDRWFQIESSYRGQKLRSSFHARPRREAGYQLIRLTSGSQP